MGIVTEFKARIIARKVRGMLKSAKKYTVLASVALTGLVALASALGWTGAAEFLALVQGHSGLDPEAAGAPVSAESISLFVLAAVQLYTVAAKLVADWKKGSAPPK